jgi:hypothetical protein
VKDVRFALDHKMVERGLAPLLIDNEVTDLDFWGFSRDLVRRLARLNQLYDRQVNWKDPADPTWRLSERDRREFNALLDLVVSEIFAELSADWKLVVETRPIPPSAD